MTISNWPVSLVDKFFNSVVLQIGCFFLLLLVSRHNERYTSVASRNQNDVKDVTSPHYIYERTHTRISLFILEWITTKEKKTSKH